MSVLEKDRKVNNDLKTITYANEIRFVFTTIMFRDFWIKDETNVIRKKYKIRSEDDAYYDDYVWLLEEEKKILTVMLANLTTNLTAANSIYPTNENELKGRRTYQNRAICNLYELKSELQYIVQIFNVDVNKYVEYTDMLDMEIGYIKCWRKSNKKFRKNKNFIE